MVSVTQRIKQISQPRGGYLNPNEFEKKEFNDNELLKEENIARNLVGMVVDYLTRFMLEIPLEKAFKISLIGASLIGKEETAYELLTSIKGIDSKSIYNACKLVGFDVCFRAGSDKYKDINTIEPDDNTINNIRIMVRRSILFFKKYGPVTKDAFIFEGGYTKIIDSGDGDFLTEDTLWDFKVSKNTPTSAHTLQLLVYYIMGTHSIHPEFKSVTKIGIFNPRTNCVYLKSISEIPKEIIEEISKNVIGYNNDENYDEVANNDMLSMIDIMKELSCSRYIVMKHYSKNDLPLIKINNKYCIKKDDLINWKEEMQERSRRQLILIIIIYSMMLVVAIIFVILLLIKIL